MQLDTKAIKILINEAIDGNPTVCNLKSDVAILKSDVASIKTKQDEHSRDIQELKTDVKELKSNVIYLGVMMEDMKQQQQLILDAVIPAKQRASQVDNVVSKVDDHEHRLCAVESMIKGRDLKGH